MFDEIKQKTSKLRAHPFFDENERIEELVQMLNINNDYALQRLKLSENKFNRATESYLLVRKGPPYAFTSFYSVFRKCAV